MVLAGSDLSVLGPAGTLAALLERASRAALDVALVGRGAPDALAACLHGAVSGQGGLLLAGGERLLELRAGRDVAELAAIDGGTGRGPEPGAALRPVFRWLLARGIGPGLVVVAAPDGAEVVLPPEAARARVVPVPVAEGDDGSGLASLLEAQLALRSEPSVPDVDRDPAWSLTWERAGDGHAARVQATLQALANGSLGVQGDLEWDAAGSGRLVLANGAYGEGPDGLVRPLCGPTWTQLGRVQAPAATRAVLDLRAGVLRREPLAGTGPAVLRFVSLSRPSVAALRAAGVRDDDTAPLAVPAGDVVGLAAEHRARSWVDEDGTWRAHTTSDRARIEAAAHEAREATSPGAEVVERVVALRTTGPDEPADAAVRADLDAARSAGFDVLLHEHRAAWAARWADAAITIHGDPDTQLAVRFALFHLLSCAPVEGEAAVGARGLTGLGYAGHVFWDTDVFVLPALAATLPAAARSVLAYRIARLPAARREAARRGYDGARFPWESADTGEDVTPRAARDLEGRIVPIRTGEHEEHISSDVAWALLHYVDWTGDVGVLASGGRSLLLETARYWASRIREDAEGRAHLYGVIGPDEYHEVVDDNAYTNVLVRWHLRRAAAIAGPEQARSWRRLADALVDGYDPGSGRHEQFAGFWSLEPLLISEIAEPPVAADLLLGRERVARTQVIKQPDVLMAHHLVPGELPAGALEADLAFYLPRTAHGSSLSPAICASLLARSGSPDEALKLLDIAARIDLDDLTATTASGLHLATMGGLWQAVVVGFGGVRPGPAALVVAPCLPRGWEQLDIRVRYRGVPVGLALGHDRITVDAAAPVPVAVHGQVAATPACFEQAGDAWRRTT